MTDALTDRLLTLKCFTAEDVAWFSRKAYREGYFSGSSWIEDDLEAKVSSFGKRIEEAALRKAQDHLTQEGQNIRPRATANTSPRSPSNTEPKP